MQRLALVFKTVADDVASCRHQIINNHFIESIVTMVSYETYYMIYHVVIQAWNQVGKLSERQKNDISLQ